ncbi:hypothetical protein Tco_1462721, partial [Tanacetum coccineum]
EWNSGDDQLRLRWMIYLMVLADAADSAEIRESSLTRPELVLDMTDKFLFDELRDRVINDVVTQLKVFDESLRWQAKLLAVRYLVKVSRNVMVVDRWNSKCNFELT